MLAIVNPPRWEVGHVAWFQEYWCLRRAERGRYAPARNASILPNADALYNSATVPHDVRWDLPLPGRAQTWRNLETVRVTAQGQGAYLQTGLIQAFAAHHLVQAPPRKLGFASPCEAFGHRELLGALEAYGFVRVETG